MTDDAPYTLHRGTRPLVVSVPHSGREIPPVLVDRYLPRALNVEDTDWHLDQLYDFVRELGASLLVPRYSRYVIDLNRPPDNQPMYPGANNTELCPTRFFSGDPLYREGQAPTPEEVQLRVARYWRPYHDALAGELQRLRAEHGHVVLFDAHSIKSELPWLFEGTLPALNLGTAAGTACAPGLRDALGAVMASQSVHSHVIDGRFKGGHITRRYGQPSQGVHAVQLEMCWRCYMEESTPAEWHALRAGEITPLLRKLVQAMLDWRPA